jgi:hypothetical protein
VCDAKNLKPNVVTNKLDQFQHIKSSFDNVKIAIYCDIIISQGNKKWLMNE